MKHDTRFITILAVTAILVCGCGKWLDIQPYDEIAEEDLLSTEDGFRMLLNGIYIELNDDMLYGGALSVEMIEIMGGAYEMGTDGSVWGDYSDIASYEYGTEYWQTRFNETWNKAYELILDCNLLLAQINDKREIFSGDDYYIIKGEALALRAMLHFDMLRAFALNYQDYPDAMGIPYADSFIRKIHPQLSSKEVLGRIVDDLKEAQSLLADIDPCFDEQFKDSYYHFVQPRDNGDIFESYRAYRMNYFAVTGLLARVYDYMGEPEQAYECAKYVIDKSDEGYFTFTDEYDLATDLRYRDVIMQNELLFALDGIDVKQLFYQADAGSNSNYALLDVESLYPDADDFRHYCVGESSTTGRTISYKYYKTDSGSSYAGKIPMIRLSEMYLIAANAVYATNPDEAVGYLTTIRKMRGASQVVNSNTYETFLAELTTEARREFLGEGQMFYWYKRHGLPVTRQGAELTLTPTQTCLPMPANEVEFGDRIEDYLNL